MLTTGVATFFLFILSYTHNGASTLFELHPDAVILPTGQTISKPSVLSKLSCAFECDRTFGCNSFSYNESQNMCTLVEAAEVVVQSMTVSTDGISLHTKVCRDGWWAFRRNCYKVFVEAIPKLDDALAYCEAENSYLTDIRDKNEFSFITALISIYTWQNTNYNSVWVGGGDRQTEGDYIWFSDNSSIPSDVLVWSPGQPNNYNNQDCMLLIVSTTNFGKFHDDYCTNPSRISGLICKSELDRQ